MSYALIHNSQLILGPIGYNVRMINSELEDLELTDRIQPSSYSQVPIHFSDELTHLLPIEEEIPSHDVKYHNIGNFSWEIITENDIPQKVKLTYPIIEKTLEEVKNAVKEQIVPERKNKENTNITLNINGTDIIISTAREERLMLASKLSASPGTHNFKFQNTWLEITTTELQYIMSEIDKVVQDAYDWELSKLKEIDNCQSIDEVYNVEIVQIKEDRLQKITE